MNSTQEQKIVFEKNVTYEIGKTTAIVSCNFRENNKETVSAILTRLIQADFENI